MKLKEDLFQPMEYEISGQDSPQKLPFFIQFQETFDGCAFLMIVPASRLYFHGYPKLQIVLLVSPRIVSLVCPDRVSTNADKVTRNRYGLCQPYKYL
jgi:hypothetical protein